MPGEWNEEPWAAEKHSKLTEMQDEVFVNRKVWEAMRALVVELICLDHMHIHDKLARLV